MWENSSREKQALAFLSVYTICLAIHLGAVAQGMAALCVVEEVGAVVG